MKIYVLSPNIDSFFKEEHHQKLQETNAEIILVKKQKEMSDIEGLFDSDDDKILAIDPDFNNWTVKNKDLDKIKNLKAVVLQTTSFSWIDINHLKEKGIPVINLRGFSTEAVAEWALLMAMNVARRIPLVVRDDWKQDYSKHQGIELKGKIAGVIGLGSIGSRAAELFQGIGMEVIYWSKNSTDERFKRVELEELMKTADVISPHTAQNNETNSLITDEMLKSMKKTAIFVSTIHNIYNHDLVLQMVKEGNLFGYGFETAKPEMDKYDGNVWAGPELAWATDGSISRNTDQWIEAVVKASQGNFENQVNK